MFEFGFMLFDPSSTFASVRGNIDFLRTIVGDGSAAATFCKMLPYDGTPIKDELERSGRLRGDVCAPDYDFLDPQLDDFYRRLTSTVDVTGWIHGHKALSPQLNWALNEAAVLAHLFPRLPGIAGYRAGLRKIAQESNQLLFRVVEELADEYTNGAPQCLDVEELQRRSAEFLERLVARRNAFVVRHQSVLLAALERPVPRRAA